LLPSPGKLFLNQLKLPKIKSCYRKANLVTENQPKLPKITQSYSKSNLVTENQPKLLKI
jgi:hypothetical protein